MASVVVIAASAAEDPGAFEKPISGPIQAFTPRSNPSNSHPAEQRLCHMLPKRQFRFTVANVRQVVKNAQPTTTTNVTNSGKFCIDKREDVQFELVLGTKLEQPCSCQEEEAESRSRDKKNGKKLVCVMLHVLHSSQTDQFSVKYRIGLVNQHGEELFASQSCLDLPQRVNADVSLKREVLCLPQAALFNPKYALIVNNSLNVLCTVSLGAAASGASSVWSGTYSAKPPYYSFNNDHSELLASGKFCDFALVFEGQRYAVHREVVAAKSSVLANLMEEDSRKEQPDNWLKIVATTTTTTSGDHQLCTQDIFEQFVYFIYAGSVNKALTVEMATVFLEWATKYQVAGLRSYCAHHLATNLQMAIIPRILDLTCKYPLEDLEERCIQFFTDHSDQMSEALWSTLSADHPQFIFQLFKSVSALKAKKPRLQSAFQPGEPLQSLQGLSQHMRLMMDRLGVERGQLNRAVDNVNNASNRLNPLPPVLIGAQAGLPAAAAGAAVNGVNLNANAIGNPFLQLLAGRRARARVGARAAAAAAAPVPNQHPPPPRIPRVEYVQPAAAAGAANLNQLRRPPMMGRVVFLPVAGAPAVNANVNPNPLQPPRPAVDQVVLQPAVGGNRNPLAPPMINIVQQVPAANPDDLLPAPIDDLMQAAIANAAAAAAAPVAAEPMDAILGPIFEMNNDDPGFQPEPNPDQEFALFL